MFNRWYPEVLGQSGISSIMDLDPHTSMQPRKAEMERLAVSLNWDLVSRAWQVAAMELAESRRRALSSIDTLEKMRAEGQGDRSKGHVRRNRGRTLLRRLSSLVTVIRLITSASEHWAACM